MTYADVIIDISHEKVDRDFQYRIPDELEQEIKPGVVVTVPFGKGNTLRKGYVIGVTEKAQYDTSRIKMIQSVSTDDETTESRLIALAAWMKETYGSTMIQALKTVLPVKDKIRAKEKRLIFFCGERQAAKSYWKNSPAVSSGQENVSSGDTGSRKTGIYLCLKELGAGASVLDF